MSGVRGAAATLAAAMLLAGCITSPPSATRPVPGPSSASPTMAAPSAPPPPSSTAASSSAPALVPPTTASYQPPGASRAAWDLVALGDSNVAGWGVRNDEPFSPQAAFPGLYAGRLAAEQGVTVTLHSYYPDQLGNEVRTVAEWANVVRLDPSMRADLSGAEIVILLVGYHDLLPAVLFGGCPTTWPAMRECVARLTDPMPAAFADLYGEIASLVPDGATVLVNNYGIPWPIYQRWSGSASWDEIRDAVFEDWRTDLECAAENAGFRVIGTYGALNEPGGRPRFPDDELTSDGWHFSATGHSLVADVMLREDGLEAP